MPIIPPGVPAVRTVAVGGPLGPQGVPGQSAIQRVASQAMAAGQVVRTHASGQQMQPATTDLRTRPFDAILLGDIGGGATGNFHVAGPVPANVLNLGAGYACAVGVDATGAPVRATDPACVSAPNWVGFCDANGNVTWNPVRQPVFYADDFGCVADGVTPNDDQVEILRVALNNSPHNVVEFGFGVYRFNGRPSGYAIGGLGPDAFPFGTIFRGQGVPDLFRPDPGPGPLSNATGTVLEMHGPGVGLHIGYSVDANYGNGGGVRDLCIRGALPTGNADYPNINEIGLEILTDTGVSVERVRVTGFKYNISLDGCETTWLNNISFDGANNGYTDAVTNLGDNSACALRIGSFKCIVSGAANGCYVSNVQFNNTFYGTWHKDGVCHEIRNANYELPGGWALLHGSQQVLYINCLGEGQTVSSFHGRNEGGPSSCFGLNIINCFFDGSAPVLKLENVAIGNLVFVGNECSNCVLFEIIEGGHFVAGPVLCEANHLPASGPSAFQLSTESYGVSGIVGTSINDFTKADAALDLRLLSFSVPMLRMKAGPAFVFGDEGQDTSQYGARWHMRQAYNPNTGRIGVHKSEYLQNNNYGPGAATHNLGGAPSPSQGGGRVTIDVSGVAESDRTKQGTWTIYQRWKDDGGGPSLVGSPTPLIADGDPGFVTPVIVVSGGKFYAQITEHATLTTDWSVVVTVLLAGA